MIKVYFAPNWGLTPEQMLVDYKKQSPQELGKWKNIESTTNEDEADYLVIQDFCNDSLLNKFPKDKRLYFSREAMDFESQKKYTPDLVNRFSYWDGSGYLWTKWAYPGDLGGVNRVYDELIKEDYNFFEPLKNKTLSCILSDKKATYGHKLRWDFMKKFIEKIYWGGCDLSKFFPEGSYITMDIEKEGELERICNLIKNDDYQKRIPALKEARDLILNKYNVWPMLHEIINTNKVTYYE